MSEQARGARPRQVTVAGWLIVVGSLFVLAMVFERVADLHTIETREAVQRFLSQPPGEGLGLDDDDVLGILRVLAMVAGACAAAAAILGYYALQRSRSARLGLAVLAPPLFLAGMVTGGFMSSVVAAAAVILWFQPARDWFDGVQRARPDVTARPTARPDVRPADPPTPPPAPPEYPTRPGQPDRPPASASQPRAVPGFGSHTGPVAGTTTAPAPTGPPVPSGAATGRPPTPVVWACVLTWVCSGLAIAGMLLSAIALATAPDMVLDEVRRQRPDVFDEGVTEGLLRTATYVLTGVAIVWGVAASVFAALAYRRVPWARVALLVSACAAAVFFLLAAIGNVLALVPLGACLATVVLLVRPDVRAWYSSRGWVQP